MRYKSILLAISVLFVLSCKHKERVQNETEQKKFPSETVRLLSEQIDASPDNADLYHKRALAYLDLSMPTEALTDVGKALQLSPQNTAYTITMGDIYFAMGNIDNAKKSLITASDNDPGNTEPILKLAELNLILKDYDMMNRYLKNVLAIDAKNAKVHFMRAIALKEQGDTTKALRALIEATTLDPEYYDAFVQAGIICMNRKDPVAEDFLNTANNLQPANTEARYALAMFYQENGQIQQAVQQYNTILTIDNKFVNAHYNLGYICLVETADYQQAIKHFTNAVTLKPDYAEAYFNRGYAYELLGKPDEAKADYVKSLSLKENYSKAIDGLNRLERMLRVR